MNTQDHHIDRLGGECSDLRAKLQEVMAQLGAAEEALLFYANPTNYTVKGSNTPGFQNVLIGDYTESENIQKVYVAGARARGYFGKYRP